MLSGLAQKPSLTLKLGGGEKKARVLGGVWTNPLTNKNQEFLHKSKYIKAVWISERWLVEGFQDSQSFKWQAPSCTLSPALRFNKSRKCSLKETDEEFPEEIATTKTAASSQKKTK